MDNLFQESRANLRVKENERILWSIQNSILKGEARIRNVSLSGMLLETTLDRPFDDQCVLSFDSLHPGRFIPELGRLVWSKKKRFSKGKYFCGIEFVNPPEEILSKLRERVQRGIMRFTNIRKFRSILNVVLFMAMIALTVTIVWLSIYVYRDMALSNQKILQATDHQAMLTQKYVQMYHDTELRLAGVTTEMEATKRLYQDSELMLQNVRQELNSTKAILAQTETMLTNAKGELESLQNVNQTELAKTKAELNNTIALLEQKNIQLTEEMTQLRGELQYYEGDVRSIDEGKALIVILRNRMKLVKSKIKYFKREARSARDMAQTERDKILSLLGNNGYFMKDGNVVKVDLERYEAESLKGSKKDLPKDQKIEVDVTIIE